MFLQELISEDYLYSTGALIHYFCIFTKMAGYYLYCVAKTPLGHFIMHEGIVTFLKINSK